MNFNPNDKVVCIDDDFSGVPLLPPFGGWPKKGTVYCVKFVRPSTPPIIMVCGLVGIVGSINDGGLERGFGTHRFRKVSEVGHPQVESIEEPSIP